MKIYAKHDVGERHIEITRDDYNWIILHGPRQLKSFYKHADYWYFSSLESMLLRLHTLLRDHGMRSIAYEDVVVATQDATSQIKDIAATIESQGGVG